MNQQKIGEYIAKKRKEHNMTQIQLAEKLGVSNKTVSKWENGKCMPDYSVIKQLCQTLDTSVGELLNGDDAVNKAVMEDQTFSILERISVLEKERIYFIGIGLVFMGILLLVLSKFMGGTNVQDFISGLLFGILAGRDSGRHFCDNKKPCSKERRMRRRDWNKKNVPELCNAKHTAVHAVKSHDIDNKI